MKGKFITFEGPEGSGKSTVIVAVKDYLEKEGYSIFTTREPGGSKIAEDIREIILDKENTEMDAHTEAFLYAAARSQHFNEKILPALEADKIILCDRFVDSSLAYQGYARGLGIDNVYEINKFAIGNKLPELTIFFDVPPEVGLKRVFSNTRKVDRLDLESLDFHNLVYKGYMEIAKKYENRFKIVDGTNPVERVIEDTIKIIKTII